MRNHIGLIHKDVKNQVLRFNAAAALMTLAASESCALL
jgi:hypothetical protein